MLVRTHIEVLWSTLTLHIKPVLQAHLGTKNETKQKAALQDYNLARAPNLSRGVFGILVHRRQYQQWETLWEENKRTPRHIATSSISRLCPQRRQFLRDLWLSHICRYNNAAGMTKHHSTKLQSTVILAPPPPSHLDVCLEKGSNSTQTSNIRKKGKWSEKSNVLTCQPATSSQQAFWKQQDAPLSVTKSHWTMTINDNVRGNDIHQTAQKKKNQKKKLFWASLQEAHHSFTVSATFLPLSPPSSQGPSASFLLMWD